MTKLATTAFHTNIIDQIQESVDEAANTTYYLFAAEHVSRSSNTIPTPVDMTKTVYVDAYRKMLFGKRIKHTDIKPMIPNNLWEANTQYAMYDDSDSILLDYSNFYVVVNETNFLHVYKCLDNNMNAVSTSQPTYAHITGSNTTVYQTSDGYRWKYMYSFSSSENDQFSTPSFIPVVANTDVLYDAIKGSLDIIKIENGGRNYGNYTDGTFSGSDVRISGNSVVYKITNTNISQVNGYYSGCLMYINSGTGAGQYKEISDYFSNSSGSYTVVNNAFFVPPENGSTYEINPRINITGGGDETIEAVGRGLVNALAANSIYRIEILNRGENYTYHVANVVANDVVGVTTIAEIRPIYSPPNGHGYDPVVELGVRHMGIGMNFANTEGDKIPALNSFQKIGIIKNPKFANVQINYQDANGAFTNDEFVYKINPIRVDTNSSINTTSNVVSSNTGDYLNQFQVGDYVYLKSSNTLSHMLATVNSISNATYMTLSSNGKFACTETLVYLANVSTVATVNATINATHMTVQNVSGQFETSDIYVGLNSGAKAVVNTVIINSVEKTMNTFIQMYKYSSTMSSGTFSLDELVYQGTDLESSTANARLHSANISGGVATVYTTEQIGQFANAETIHGNTSGASATINNIYSPELVAGSGDVIFLENVQTITRANNNTESFKLIFEFHNE